MNNTEILEVDGAVDIRAATDYLYSDIMGTSDLRYLPASVLFNNTAVLNQALNNDPDTTYACTRASVSRWVNEMNHIEQSGVTNDYVEERRIALAEWEAIITAGGSIRGSVEQARARGYIFGYAICQSRYDMQYALSIDQLIATGSREINRAATRENWGVAVRGRSYGHAFIKVGYDGLGFIYANSYGEDKYSYTTTEGVVVPGAFCIPYDMLDVLYTSYALFDKKDIDKIKQEKIRQDNKDIEAMIALGITNGNNMDDNITRKEMAIMLGRMYRNLKV